MPVCKIKGGYKVEDTKNKPLNKATAELFGVLYLALVAFG